MVDQPNSTATKTNAGKITLSFILVIALFLICLGGVFAIADMIFEDNNLVFDMKVFDWIRPHINPANTRMMLAATFFGSQVFLLPANLLLIGIFYFVKKLRKYSWKIAIVAITSTIVLFSLKFLLERQRPLVPLIAKAHGYSFPSGHTFTSVTFFGMLCYIVYRSDLTNWIKWVLIICMTVMTLMIGFSRIYLSLHYATDVIAGFCLGVIWLLLSKWVLVKSPLAYLQRR
ncbi:MAG: phosphatase family protein [Ferruginibacter sp.]|nr:phosphatase family protein [Ferruginibacter sp.]